jgi:hypothetical protein
MAGLPCNATSPGFRSFDTPSPSCQWPPRSSALVAWGLAVLAFDYYFTPPYDSLKTETAEIPHLLIFTLVAGFMATMSGAV